MAVSPSFLLPSGEAVPITALAGESVGELRPRLAAALGVTTEFVQLLVGGTELEDDQLVDHITATGVSEVYAVTDPSALVETFEDFELHENLLRGIRSYGFNQPSTLQKRTIRPLIEGRNIVVQSQSGTGKTAAYLVASLQRIDFNLAVTQTLVVAPTRELACPIQHAAATIGAHMRLKSLAFGGIKDILRLRECPHFVVGTPGRVHDIISKRHLRLEDLKMFVLDEVDTMMSHGFKGLIYETMELLPPKVQLAVFSATMPPDLLEHMKSFLRDPVRVVMCKSKPTLHGLSQYCVKLSEKEKNRKLNDLLDALEFDQVVIFVKSAQRAVALDKLLVDCCFPSIAIHSGLSEEDRIARYTQFKEFQKRVMVSTDLFGRGIDIERANIVINYDMPDDSDCYLHRVGRARHFGIKRLALTFVSTDEDVEVLKKVQERFNVNVEEMPAQIDITQISRLNIQLRSPEFVNQNSSTDRAGQNAVSECPPRKRMRGKQPPKLS